MERIATLAVELGVLPRDGLGVTWPELGRDLLKLYRERVANLPFVPAGWLAQIEREHNAGNIMVLRPALFPGTSTPVPDAMPAWLSSIEAKKAWTEASERVRLVVNAYAQGKLEIGRREMAAAQFDAAFWNGLYTATKAVADLPKNIVEGVTGGAQYVAGGLLRSIFSSWIVWVGIAAAGLFFMGPTLLRSGAAKFAKRGK